VTDLIESSSQVESESAVVVPGAVEATAENELALAAPVKKAKPSVRHWTKNLNLEKARDQEHFELLVGHHVYRYQHFLNEYLS
jgi:hypothetical protein